MTRFPRRPPPVNDPILPAVPAPRRVPLGVKLAYTAFLAVLVPYYWMTYGPTNFLYFCDVALFCTLAAVWTGHPLPASAAAVGILLPQTLWCVDFLGTLVGRPVVGMTAYMFDGGIDPFARGLSFFHFWLPWLLVWLVGRLGYDRRAWACWSAASCGLLLVGYFLLPGPPAPVEDPNLPVNVNYVHGLSDEAPQTWVSPLGWLTGLLVGLPLAVYLPTHLLLAWAFDRRRGPTTTPAPPG